MTGLLSKTKSPINPKPSGFGGGERGSRFLATVAGCLLAFSSPLLQSSEVPANLTRSDVALLDEVERRAVLYFVEQTDPISGLTRDRAPAEGGSGPSQASVAASGFALTAWGIAAQRGWLGREEAARRSKTTLRFILEEVDQENGWLYHFVDVSTGRRMWDSEASTIDTALFLQGALFAREYFKDPEMTELVNRIYARIDFSWALNGGTTLAHGWKPESGFLPYRWDSYSEMLGLYLLGIGAPGKALHAAAWHAWSRGPVVQYAGRTFINCPPLFTHQYTHAWFDFRGRRDAYADYWKNSVDATLAQRQWCADLSGRFSKWSLALWGVTASDSATGYVAWGGPSRDTRDLDGTLVPCAPAGSLPFAPKECLAALRSMLEFEGGRAWKRYGFVDAFNTETGWVADHVLAIDQGITLLMAENLRSGLVWDYFMRAPEVQKGLRLAGFESDRSDTTPRLVIAAIR